MNRKRFTLVAGIGCLGQPTRLVSGEALGQSRSMYFLSPLVATW